jgi:hypothetical protein
MKRAGYERAKSHKNAPIQQDKEFAALSGRLIKRRISAKNAEN